MYVVRRAFRNFNQMMLPGSTVEPGSVKRFKTRLKDRFIVEVNAQNFEQWRVYFNGKFGVDLATLTAETETETETEVKTDVPATKVVAKVVAKAVIKN